MPQLGWRGLQKDPVIRRNTSTLEFIKGAAAEMPLALARLMLQIAMHVRAPVHLRTASRGNCAKTNKQIYSRQAHSAGVCVV